MIDEGSPEEVTESFYKIYDGLSEIFEAEDSKKDDFDDDFDGEDEGSEEDKSKDDDESEDDEKDDKKSKKSKKSKDDDESKDDENVEESYIKEGMKGMETPTNKKKSYNSLKAIISEYANS